MSNSNQTPNSKHRRVLRQHCIDRDGNGVTVSCAFGCGAQLTLEDVTLDRFPITGCEGGTYRKSNVRAACLSCNSSDGARVMHKRAGHRVRVRQTITIGDVVRTFELDIWEESETPK